MSKLILDHTTIINQLEQSIKYYNWNFIVPLLPEKSFLVGGYIRDIILKRITEDIDVDIVVPSNAIDIGKKISNSFKGKFILLDKERKVVRIIFNHITIDLANQTSNKIEEDLKSRDFSINAIAFSFDNKCLIDPLNGIKDIELSLLRTYSEINMLNDPLRILRCFRFVSELNFKIDEEIISFIKKYKERLTLIARERINYEIQRIVRGPNAIDSILLLKKINIFGFKKLYEDSFFIDLKTINYEQLNQNEKDKFLPFFFISQIFGEVSLERFMFNKSQIIKTKLLRKWHLILKKRNILDLNESERFKLHQELEEILPCFIFYIPEDFRKEWLNRWRDKNDKLFHPKHLINGDVIKENLKIKDGPLLGKLLHYLSKEFAYDRLNNFDEAIYKAKQWIQQNAPKCD